MADSRSNRSILMDNTSATGTIYTNINDVAQANQATTLVRLVLKSKQANIKAAGAAVQKVTDPVGSLWASDGLLIRTFATLSPKAGEVATKAAPTGKDMILTFRRKRDGVITTLSPTLTIPQGAISAEISVSLSFLAGDYLYSDVTQIGSISPGYGLVIYFNYY